MQSIKCYTATTFWVFLHISSVQFSLSVVSDLVTPWTAARQSALSITNSRRLFKLMFTKSVIPSNHLILCQPLLLLPSIFPSIRVFSNESVFRIRWPKCWSFSFSISSSNEYSGLISFNECSYSTSQFLLPVLAEALPEQIFVYFQLLWSQRSFSLDSTYVVIVQSPSCVQLFATHGLKFAQIHVCWVSDVIQPSHPLSSPSPTFNLSSLLLY